MREPLKGCSAIILVALAASTSSANACPWNGCGTDAYNSYMQTIYDSYSAASVYGPQIYGDAPVYGYSAPVLGYYNDYGPRPSYYYRARVARPRQHIRW
jgi:hypothetical protein